MVAKGLAVEVEDRGLGMAEEDYTSFNEQLAVPPQFDVVALADDLRLGMFVIGRLAHRHGIAVTLRSSPYGGTTAIVLVPHEIVVREAPGGAVQDGDAPEDEKAAADGRGATDAERSEAPRRAEASRGTEHAAGPAPEPRPLVTARTASAASSAASATREVVPRRDGLTPLPRRVPQTSLVQELREESAPAGDDGSLDDFTAEAAAASLAGFQRGTLRARDDDAEPPHDEEAAAVPRQAAAGPVPSTPPADR
jgi:hypothetical protein